MSDLTGGLDECVAIVCQKECGCQKSADFLGLFSHRGYVVVIQLLSWIVRKEGRKEGNELLGKEIVGVVQM